MANVPAGPYGEVGHGGTAMVAGRKLGIRMAVNLDTETVDIWLVQYPHYPLHLNLLQLMAIRGMLEDAVKQLGEEAVWREFPHDFDGEQN